MRPRRCHRAYGDGSYRNTVFTLRRAVMSAAYDIMPHRSQHLTWVRPGFGHQAPATSGSGHQAPATNQ